MKQLPATSAQIDWKRIYPAADHRWSMGLRPGDAAAFFAHRDPSGAVLAERTHWLSTDAEKYSALLPEAGPALLETVELARTLGATIDTALPASGQLLALGRNWETDFAWMHPDGRGKYCLAGGVVCFPSSWALREKLGCTMSEIHHPVPGLNDALARKIELFLDSQIPGAAWTRENVGYSRDAELNHHPSRPRRPLDSAITAGECFIRLEHQLLLKLPRSRSILFGIRVEVIPLVRLLEEPGAAAGLTRALSTMSHAVAAYKGIAAAIPALLALLRQTPPAGRCGEQPPPDARASE